MYQFNLSSLAHNINVKHINLHCISIVRRCCITTQIQITSVNWHVFIAHSHVFTTKLYAPVFWLFCHFTIICKNVKDSQTYVLKSFVLKNYSFCSCLFYTQLVELLGRFPHNIESTIMATILKAVNKNYVVVIVVNQICYALTVL